MLHAAVVLSLMSSMWACIPTDPGTMPTVMPCRACDPDAIAITRYAPNSKPMAGDVTTYPLPKMCATRKFTCTGTNAVIQIFKNGMAGGLVNGGTMEAAIVVTCKDAGTGWERIDLPGELITALECSSV